MWLIKKVIIALFMKRAGYVLKNQSIMDWFRYRYLSYGYGVSVGFESTGKISFWRVYASETEKMPFKKWHVSR